MSQNSKKCDFEKIEFVFQQSEVTIQQTTFND
jgi:hypothetical protein